MTNIDTTDNLQIYMTEIEKMTNYKYLGQTTAMENRTKQEVSIRIKNRMEWGEGGGVGFLLFFFFFFFFGFGFLFFLKLQRNLLERHLPMSLNRKVFNCCVLPAMTYGCQTLSLTKVLAKKLETSYQAMERRTLNVKLKDRICNTIIR